MGTPTKKPLIRSGWFSLTVALALLVLIVAILYWARAILIPIALAIVLTFILGPVVSALRRRGLGRTWSVVVTVVLTFTVLGGITAIMMLQLKGLADQLPDYRENIRAKAYALRKAATTGSIARVQDTVQDVLKELDQSSEPVPVIVKKNEKELPPLPNLQPFVGPLASTGLVVVLVVFILLRREDLRNRVLRLVGARRLTLTTKIVDEATRKVSKYLLRQCLLNAGFGVAVGLGLFLMGLPFAIVWGVLAGLLRFVPYVGPWIGAAAPFLISLAVFDGWMQPMMVLVLFLVLELINNLILEPILYGFSVGISEVALIIMIAFWTWLWGPIGLVLATPLTVCLVVLSKYVPELNFVSLLLGSEPILEPHDVFYQRLVAKDVPEALEIVADYQKTHNLTQLFEDLLLPTLVFARQDLVWHKLSEGEFHSVLGAIREILETTPPISASETTGKPEAAVEVLGCPADDEADELALIMLGKLLTGCQLKVCSSEMLASEIVAEAQQLSYLLVCIAELPAGRRNASRQLSKLFRARLPGTKLILGIWGSGSASDEEAADLVVGDLADYAGYTISETANQIQHMVRLPATLTPLTEVPPQVTGGAS